jgi:potassium-transporting ATPase KdpC subunit
VLFFENFSKDNPGKIPSGVTKQMAGGKTQTVVEPVASGSDIQSIFFDMWRQDHPDAALQNVPGDMVKLQRPDSIQISRSRMRNISSRG